MDKFLRRTISCLFTLFYFFLNDASAYFEYKDIPADSNAIAYDQKLLLREKCGGYLWADNIYSEALLKAAQQKTIRDACIAHNLSFTLRKLPKEDNNFILPLLNIGLLNYSTGNYDKSFHYLLEAKEVIDSMRQKKMSLGAEQSKIFKGEPLEQALASFYMGLMLYSKKDFQNARAMFAQMLELDRETVPLQENLEKLAKKNARKLGNKQEVINLYNFLGNDNRLAYYMLARTYKELGEDQNVRISLGNSNNWKPIPDFLTEKSCGNFKRIVNRYDTPPSKDNPFNTSERLENDNLIMLIQIGFAPEKKLGGHQGSKDFLSPREYPERKALVYVDGNFLCEAYPMFNLLHQLASMSRTEKDTTQTGKAIGKSILAGFALLLDATAQAYTGNDANLYDTVQNSWSVAADTRTWGSLPNEIHLASGWVNPGLHTITVLFFDGCGNHLPHYEQTHYFIPVKERKETFLTIRSLRDKCNTLKSFSISKIKYKQKNNQVIFNSKDLPDLHIGKVLDIITVNFESQLAGEKFLNERHLSSGNEYKITKVGTAKINKLKSKEAICEVIEGNIDSMQAYFITNHKLPLPIIEEVSNYSILNIN